MVRCGCLDQWMIFLIQKTERRRINMFIVSGMTFLIVQGAESRDGECYTKKVKKKRWGDFILQKLHF